METNASAPFPKRQQKLCTANVYPNGTITDRGGFSPAPTIGNTSRPKKRSRRSTITSFSKHSAARLRRLLVQACGPEGWACFGATLTVPGPPISPEEWRRIWAAFRHKMKRLGNLALIWRIELQQRGQPHIHCICWGRKGQGRIQEYWEDALALLGPYEGPADIDREGYIICSDGNRSDFKPGWVKCTSRALWPGARKHAVRIDGLGTKNNIGWWRYVAAHASKSKQAQLGWHGRQWGVMNGRLIDRAQSVLVELPEKAIVKASRYLQKLTKCRFVTAHGRQSWFASPLTVLRLFAWAKAEVSM